jgi:hypothetical protein
MPAFTSISRFRALLGALLIVFIASTQTTARAQTREAAPADPESDNFLSGPFSEFGEFNSSEDEEADERFFQSGRFFGVGLGLGLTSATGNAGLLYEGGFPTIDFRLNYWFDFFVALQIIARNSVHTYDIAPDGRTNTSLFRLLGQVKYYIDTKDLSAPITFIGPHLLFGAGMYRRTDNLQLQATTETASNFGINAGGGFELTLKPKKFYLTIEALVNFVTFRDAYDPRFQQQDPNAIPDRTGLWVDSTVSLTWTW